MQFHVEKTAETTMQGMVKTATTLGGSMLMFGSIALVYAAAESAAEAFRGEADWKNGALAGLASGVLLLQCCMAPLQQPCRRLSVALLLCSDCSCSTQSSQECLLLHTGTQTCCCTPGGAVWCSAMHQLVAHVASIEALQYHYCELWLPPVPPR